MEKETKGLIVYLGILVLYILIEPLFGLLSDYRLYGLLAKIILIGGAFLMFKEWFKFKFRFDFVALLIGLVIGFLWIGLDPFYPKLGQLVYYEFGLFELILKLFTGILIAPIIEEFFTRNFLHRFVQSKNWLLVPLGQFAIMPFVFTTIFFGFSHAHWVPGIIAGILLNLLWYKRKDMNSVVVAHSTANFVLWVIVVLFGLYQFW